LVTGEVDGERQAWSIKGKLRVFRERPAPAVLSQIEASASGISAMSLPLFKFVEC